MAQFDTDFALSVYEYRENLAQVASEPEIVDINYYDVTISMKFWNKAKVYAIRIWNLNNPT